MAVQFLRCPPGIFVGALCGAIALSGTLAANDGDKPRNERPVVANPPLPPLPLLPAVPLLPTVPPLPAIPPLFLYAPNGSGSSTAGQQPRSITNPYVTPGTAAPAPAVNPYAPYARSDAPGATGKQNLRSAFRDLINARGELDWPLGLRVLPPALETQPLRDKIEAEVAIVLDRAEDGKSATASVRQANRDIERLRTLLNDRAVTVPLTEHAVQEAQSFLRRLQARLKGL
jgi:hypothetical protein